MGFYEYRNGLLSAYVDNVVIKRIMSKCGDTFALTVKHTDIRPYKGILKIPKT